MDNDLPRNLPAEISALISCKNHLAKLPSESLTAEPIAFPCTTVIGNQYAACLSFLIKPADAKKKSIVSQSVSVFKSNLYVSIKS